MSSMMKASFWIMRFALQESPHVSHGSREVAYLAILDDTPIVSGVLSSSKCENLHHFLEREGRNQTIVRLLVIKFKSDWFLHNKGKE